MIGSTNACGGMVDNEELTALKENVLEDKSFLGYESDEPIIGTMPNNGETSDQSLNCEEHFIVKRGYHAKDFKVKGNSLASQTKGTAGAAEILKDKIAWINGKRTVGTMPNNPAQNATLKCGQSKIIPKGYTPGGTILAANLASQTPGTATAANILSGKTAWVNGSKVSGTMANRGQAQYGGWGEAGDYYAINALPEGAYFKSGASWAPEARCKKDIVRNALGIRADKIKKGEVIAGITGTWEGYVSDGVNDLYNRGVFAEDFYMNSVYGDRVVYKESQKIVIGHSTRGISFYLKRQLNLNKVNCINIELCSKLQDVIEGCGFEVRYTTSGGQKISLNNRTVPIYFREDYSDGAKNVWSSTGDLDLSFNETKVYSFNIHANEIMKENSSMYIEFSRLYPHTNYPPIEYSDTDPKWMIDTDERWYNLKGVEIYRIWLS